MLAEIPPSPPKEEKKTPTTDALSYHLCPPSVTQSISLLMSCNAMEMGAKFHSVRLKNY